MTRNRDDRYDSRNEMDRNDMDRPDGMFRDRDDGRFSSMGDGRGMDQRGGSGGMGRGYGGGQGYGDMNRDARGMGDGYRGSQGYGGQGYGNQGYGGGYDRNSGGMDRDGQRPGNMGMGQGNSGYNDDYSSGMRQGAYSDPYQGNPGYSGGSGMGGSGQDSRMGSGQSDQVSHRGKGPKGYQRSDERLKEMVSEALEDEHGVDASDIEVRVENGEVTLTGTVRDRQQKRRAEDCAEGVRGIRDVHNQIRVKRDDQNDETMTASAAPSSQKNKGQAGAS